MNHNIQAIKKLINYIYHHIQYAEFNTKSDFCMECGFDGEIQITDDGGWECPNCHNTDQSRMNVVRRTCGLRGGSR